MEKHLECVYYSIYWSPQKTKSTLQQILFKQLKDVLHTLFLSTNALMASISTFKKYETGEGVAAERVSMKKKHLKAKIPTKYLTIKQNNEVKANLRRSVTVPALAAVVDALERNKKRLLTSTTSATWGESPFVSISDSH